MVEWKKLGEVCEVLDSLRKPVAKDKRNKGDYPYYGANGIQDYVDDYIFDGTFLLFGEDGSVINADKSPVLHWATGKIWVNNHAHILKESPKARLRYLYYCLQSTDVSDIVRGVPPKINQANMRDIPIPLPSLSEQERIVGILDTFTSSIENLKAQISQRRKQYEHYRDQLLDLEGKPGVEMKTLGDVCKIFAGGDVPKENMSQTKTDKFCVPIISNGAGEKSIYGYTDLKKVNDISVTVAARGTIGYAHYRDYPYFPIIRLISVIPSSIKLSAKYLYYVLSKQKYKTPKSGIPQLTVPSISKVVIPLPSLQEQSRIVSILDTFEASIANLEAQLKEREKQYEFYRNKLLTFE